MGEKLTNLVIAALVGGIVGLLGGVIGGSATGKAKMDELEVGTLKITKQATLFSADGNPNLVLKDGSVIANNVVFGKKFMADQLQGHIIVANCVFTSPDNLMTTPMNEWQFFTEMKSTEKSGGEMIVRSPRGGNLVGQQQNNNGLHFRTGFDENDTPQFFVRSNGNGAIAQAPQAFSQTATQPVPAALPGTGVPPAIAVNPLDMQ